ncbi:dihydrofolate reductase [Candidatus Woesearchaeota archaeon]|nr:dihydrofolate reductase [Candidatus Woesearchaeota archaeon]
MKVILYMTITINGYIAKENDDAPWSDELWVSYYNIAKKFKAVVLGRRTFEMMKEVNEFEKIGNPFIVVLTKKKQQNTNNIFFVKSPTEALELLDKKGFKEVLIGGGGKLNASFMKENLVDEMLIDIEPLIFGKGIKLFAEGDFEKKLELLETKRISNNLVHLHYKFIK